MQSSRNHNQFNTPRVGDMVLGFMPSHYQQAIFNWVEKGRGDAVVEAVAGSGKTTTIIQAARRISTNRVLFCAFNNHIAKSLKDKLGNKVDCKTIHSIGLRCISSYLGNTELDENKCGLKDILALRAKISFKSKRPRYASKTGSEF